MNLFNARTLSAFVLAAMLAVSTAALARTSSGHSGGSVSREAALGLYSAAQKQGGFDSCTEVFPAKTPLSVAAIPERWKPQALCSNNFAVMHSALSKTPLVVIERLSKSQIESATGEGRTNQFYPDPRLPQGSRAELADFRGSSLDRGHLSAAANQPDHGSMAQSFALSNMVPQDPVNNRKIWAKIESDVRKYSQRAPGNVYVFSGPIFVDEHQTVGRSKVWVPTKLFKLVYDEVNQRAWAYILPNTADARVGPPVDYATFVKQTGWKFLDHVPVRGSIAVKS